MGTFSHTDNEGKIHMVDVSGKPVQLRRARAEGRIRLAEETIKLIAEDKIKKGSVLTTAEIAGVQAAKQTSQLIPLCHPLQISKVDVKAKLEANAVYMQSEVACVGQTGVEMEALTAVSVALLTVYDMCKAVDKNMKIEGIILLEKTKDGIKND